MKSAVVNIVILIAAIVGGSQLVAQEDKYLNVPMPTMGGQQFWTDYRWHDGWRVQRNWLTDHWRVLDSSDVRRAWGSRQACMSKFEQHVQASQATPPTRAVVLLHGLMRSSDSMEDMAEAIQNNGIQPISFGYASTQASIDEHAKALRELIDNLPPHTRLTLIGHSLGNIVARRAIGMWQTEGDPQNVLKRLDHMVMLGPPNQGSSLATYLSGLGLFEKLTGTSGQELGVAWKEFQSKLATPPCPFMIVAGDVSQTALKNPLLDGQNDFIVTVEETQLDGAAETLVVPVLHAYLMSDRTVIDKTLKFIK
jgi:hypothetical protein